ncbi:MULTISPECIES: small multi-drug export protein [unclassified Schlesneria]|uniref:small multi-drug export protein n=1 Tax=Schlesneria TaxID=656899 RepID=UPI0035A141F7
MMKITLDNRIRPETSTRELAGCELNSPDIHMLENHHSPPPENTLPDAVEHERMVESFLKFEKDFHKNHFAIWLGTLIGPLLTTMLLFGVVYLVSGPVFCGKLLFAAACSFAFLGRFSIVTPFSGLSPTTLFWMVTYQDAMVALFFAFHVGFMFRLPWIGPKIASLSSDSEFILAHQPWMKRMTFLGLLAFIAFPLAATGSAGGAIFGRLLGLSRWAIFWGSTLGAVIGNGAMLALTVLVKDSLPDNLENSPLIKWGGIPIILLIIFFLERRYTAMKRAFEAQRKQQADAATSAGTDQTV